MFVVGDIDDKPITIKDYGQEGRQLTAATAMPTLQSIAMAMARWILILIPVLLSHSRRSGWREYGAEIHDPMGDQRMVGGGGLVAGRQRQSWSRSR